MDHPLAHQYQYLAYAMNGALWLDEIKPGWAQDIDVQRLAMFDVQWCIAGQLFRVEAYEADKDSGYDYIVDTFGITYAANHGFVSDRHLWINLIQERLAVSV